MPSRNGRHARQRPVAVLDHATYNDDADASSGTVVFDDGVLNWHGPLPVDGVVTIRYSVTMADTLPKDEPLVNVVTSVFQGTNCPPRGR